MMEQSADLLTQQIDETMLAPIVRQVLGGKHANLTGWTCEPIHAGIGVGTAIYRVTGEALDQGKSVPWTAILKILIEQPDHVDPEGWFYWQREADFYASSLPGELPNDFRAVQCYAVNERPSANGPSEIWLWLEDVRESVALWTLDDYFQAAFHLGRFNGTFLVQDHLPSRPWLCRNGIQSLIEAAGPYVRLLQENRTNPLVQILWDNAGYEAYTAHWRNRQHYYEMLRLPPQTLCHYDAHRANLFLLGGANPERSITAIDWSYIGYGPVGADLMLLIGYALLLDGNPPEATMEIEAKAFDSYMNGLAAAGWNGNPDLVRLGQKAAGVYARAGIMRMILDVILSDERRQQIEQATGLSTAEWIGGFDVVEALGERWLEEAESLYTTLAVP
jgi:hypothetical protein